MEITDYIKPELVIVAVVLYLIGNGIKTTQLLNTRFIPLVNSIAGILICTIYVLATMNFSSSKDICMGIFTVITQGILVSGLSTGIHQISKKIKPK